MTKIKIEVSCDEEGTVLPALGRLPSIKPGSSYHEARDCRHPLGLYNISTSHVLNRVKKCADRAESYWKGEAKLKDIQVEIIDRLELAMYAAAEHVDDIERIAATFFRSDRDASQSASMKLMKKAIKPIRDEISSFANTIKHAHGRLRLYETDFLHESRRISLLGFFVEGIKDGAIAPHPVLHAGGKTVISITAFLWGITVFIWEMSLELVKFLERINALQNATVSETRSREFKDASIALARLPLYSFDDEHPFLRVGFGITLPDDSRPAADSSIYGSLLDPWSKSEIGQFLGFRLLYAGDGATLKYNLANPTKLRLTHWSDGSS